ncbi:hypothetical protein KI387_027888 [Taxus chinensis]|uniref:U1-type domain-containing protein n=1 Tax=Taxus chinensis TaxID=29808 RepID=A0AA38G0E3_TAXCH|nr:hypothetical protein KI387_027888 [Taxus chinensis]
MNPLRLTLLNEAELQELINNEIAKVEEIRRDLTRKYHEQIAELELALGEKLYQIHLHISSSQTQHEELQTKLGMNLQKESSRCLDSVLPERLGWCLICEVDCITDKGLKKHIQGKKHKSKLKMLKQDSGFPEHPGWCLLCEVGCPSEENLNKIHISGKRHMSKLRMLKQDSGFPEHPGWCSLCKVGCTSEENLNNIHISGKRHKSKLNILKQDSRFSEHPGWCLLCKVEGNTEKDLANHIVGKKHQSKLKKLKQESGEGISN